MPSTSDTIAVEELVVTDMIDVDEVLHGSMTS